MPLLVDLVCDRVLGSRGTGTEGSVRVFSNLLVGFGGSVRGGALDGLRDVVCGVPKSPVLATIRMSRC